MKPFVRWAGSKRQILPTLAGYYPSGARYIEPFCGSAALFFSLEPKSAILGDLNGDLITAMRAVQLQPDRVVEAIRRLPVGKDAYYHIRATDPETMPEISRAARFLYLNHYCFNGLYRTNKQGRFNVPYGPPKSGYPIDEEAIFSASRRLTNAMLIRGDFEATLSRVQPGDFVYLDPPYVVDARRIFSEYLPNSFSPNDLSRLESELERIDAQGAYFVASYADSAEARRLLRRWKHRRVRIKRHIAGFAGARRHNYELVATNMDQIGGCR